jgi:phosphoribosylformylglycinamidine synthase
MKFDVMVEIASLEGLADPQGQTIERALPALGFAGVVGVHVGKVIRFAIDSPDESSAADEVRHLCDRLLANPVMERAHVVLTRAPVAPAGTDNDAAGVGNGAGPGNVGAGSASPDGQPAGAHS